MKDNKLHTPAGVKDFLPDEHREMAELKNRVASVFKPAGYSFVSGPMLEYAEVFEGKGSTRPSEIFRFVDRDGDILALRPDMTPPVARMAVTNFDASDFPLRLCYIENVFRQNQSYQGKLREFTQGGIELMGLSSAEADAEVIKVAIRSCLECGLTDFRIDIGQVQFLKGLLDDAGLNAEESAELTSGILSRDYAGVTAMAKRMRMPENTKKFFTNLPLMTGGSDILINAKEFNVNTHTLEILDDLSKIYHTLEACSLEKYVHFDLGMIGHLEYYTGIIFRGFAHGTGYTILDGGRYDNLCSGFGADIPSVGFAINLNDLYDAVMHTRSKRKLQEESMRIRYC